MIKIKELSFQYNKSTQIFDDFNFDTDNAKFFGLIGINGAGKSTLLKLCLGLLNFNKGKIEVNGFNISSHLEKVLTQIGVLHENPNFPSWMKVNEYLMWLGQLRGFTKDKAIRQSNYLIDKLGLKQCKEKPVIQLSAGLTQRFGIAQALIGVPKLIFLDEPTANLDVQSRYIVLEFLQQIVEQFDTQIIIMSHILSDLERYCDSFAILHQGSIVFRDTVEHMLQTNQPRYYNIRVPVTMNMAEIEQIATSIDLNIINRIHNQLIVELSENQKLENITGQLPKNLTITPYLTVLEQIFVDETSNKDLFINTGEMRT